MRSNSARSAVRIAPPRAHPSLRAEKYTMSQRSAMRRVISRIVAPRWAASRVLMK